MRFRVLSHACLEVVAGDKTLLVDPWLVGSCYWRSWWNYPPVNRELIDDLAPDFVYITHVHWDHFHGPTLKRFSRQTPILIPLERSLRPRRDLQQMGFENIVEIPHGESYELAPGFVLTAYQFSHWGDSAAVIDADGYKILNANDAKFMGGPLKQIVKRHGSFDFALRSHSSANARACVRYKDAPDELPEDHLVYARSFYNFMECVKPRYAIPFASNHCHLHADVYAFNEQVTTPQVVENFVAAQGGFSRSELKVMVSGDRWDSEQGFDLTHEDWFGDRSARLEAYRDREADRLVAQYEREARARLDQRALERFFSGFFQAVPALLRRRMKGRAVYFQATSDEDQYYGVDLYERRTWSASAEEINDPCSIVIEASALVLRQTMALNMFTHLGISKRVAMRCRQADAGYLNYFFELLAAYEYEALPLSQLLTVRTLSVYLRRWRELLLYAQILASRLAGVSVYEIEARLMVAGARWRVLAENRERSPST